MPDGEDTKRQIHGRNKTRMFSPSKNMSYLEEKKQEALIGVGTGIITATICFLLPVLCSCCCTSIAIGFGIIALIFTGCVAVSQKDFLTYSAKKTREEADTDYYEHKFKEACQKSTETVERFDDMMKEEDKLKFIRWVIDSKSFKVWHFDKDVTKICLQPKNRVGNCVIIWWKTGFDDDDVNVQLWKDLKVSDYDFGTMYGGEGFVDNFYIAYDSVEPEIGQLLKMVEEQNAEDKARRHAERTKNGDGKNFINMMSEF